jgi:Family of unknown function (DUF6058)
VALTQADIAYVLAGYVSLEELCTGRSESPEDVHAWIEAGLMPRPSYVLPGGREMFPADYFAASDEAGGPERLRDRFAQRFLAAGGSPPELDEEWDGYLSGVYGVCLREATPETIVRKSALVRSLERLLAEPEPADPDWCARLREQVDELDALERPFSPDHDRTAFGRPPTRDTLIAAPRARYPAVFAPRTVPA